MRILHVTDCYLPRVGGIEVQVHGLARQQAAAGHDVEVWTTTGGSVADDLPVRRLPAVTATVPGPATLAALRRDIAGGRFDVVHAHSSVLSPLAWGGARAAVRAGVPAVVTVHSMLRAGSTALELSQLFGWSRWPVRLTAVSRVAAAPLRALGLDVDVLPNGVDVAWWRPAARSPWRGGEVTVVGVMRLARRKRPLEFARILGRLRDLAPSEVALRAVIVGDGPLRGRLVRELDRIGLGGRVELTGTLPPDEVRAVLQAGDLYLAPAHRESFGIAALEARCAGLPVLAMRTGGVGEFVQHGRDGLLVGSDDEMASAAAGLVATGELRRMQERSWSVPPPGVSWPEVVARSVRCYREAAGAAVAAARTTRRAASPAV